MQTFIIGGGFCGSYLGSLLASKTEIVIFEKQQIPHKVCSGIVSSRFFSYFPNGQDCIIGELEKIIVHSDRKIELLPTKKLFVLNREKLNRAAQKSARKHGAKIRHKILTKDYLKKIDGLVIGCDGALSTVAKATGWSWPKLKLGLVYRSSECSEALAHIWPVKSGFCWKFGNHKYTEYGIMANPENAKLEFQNFCIKQNINPKKIEGALIPASLNIKANEKYALCGDAAGMNKPWSGGGLLWGAIGAQMLAKNFPNFKAYAVQALAFFSPLTVLGRLAQIARVLPLKKAKFDPDFIL